MIRLHQTFGAHTGRVVTFEQDVVAVGRMPDSDLAFDPEADLDASGRHAELRRGPEGWVLADVGSRNGTWVNGRRIQKQVLHDGDELEFGLGGPRLKVQLPSSGRPISATPPGPGAPSGGRAEPSPPPPSTFAPDDRFPDTMPSVRRELAPDASKGDDERVEAQPRRRSTGEIEAIAVAAFERKTRDLRVALLGMALLMLGAIASVGAWWLHHVRAEAKQGRGDDTPTIAAPASGTHPAP